MTNQEELKRIIKDWAKENEAINKFGDILLQYDVDDVGLLADAIFSAGYMKKDSKELNEEKIGIFLAKREEIEGDIVIIGDVRDLAHAIATSKDIIKWEIK